MTYLDPLLPLLVLALFLTSLRIWGGRGKRWDTLLVGAATAALFLVSWPPIAWLTSGSLEWWYARNTLPAGEADAIVVLAGTVDPPAPGQQDPIAGHNTYLRCKHAAWLYKHWRQLPIVVTGGPVPGAERGVTHAAAMRQVLIQEGVPETMIWVEGRGKSTSESAIYSAQLLEQRGLNRVALVTEAYHMLRAERCFRRQGLRVTPAPCCFRSGPRELSFGQLLPSATAIRYNDEVLHEWVGLAWYRLSGRI